MGSLTMAIAAFLVLAPLLVLLALAVRLDSRGPTIYSEKRLGLNGKPFVIYKFRTLRPATADIASVAPSGDPRITRLGAWLRPVHLDELPQLFNIIRGDMNLVGPRPAREEMWLGVVPALKARALAFRPGLTSPASIRFNCEDRVLGKIRNADIIYRDIVFPAKVAMDVRYFESRRWWQDLKVMADTVVTVVRPAHDTACRERLKRLLEPDRTPDSKNRL